jgi:hypothetical protein
MLDLDMRGQDEDGDLRQFLVNHPRCLEPLGRVSRRHADVDDRDIRNLVSDKLDQALRVRRLTDDLEAPFAQQSRETLPKQHIVVCDRDPRCPFWSGHTAVSTRSASAWQPASATSTG